jgi:ankyrin repeat protein
MDNQTPFESAVDAIVTGDISGLTRLLREYPVLVHQRSSRPHRATLLHYLAANGVEEEHQKTPSNSVDIAKMLLDAGAEPDALASMYGGEYATLSLLVSSTPPAQAGLQVALAQTLLDYGAAIDGCGEGAWISPLITALAFGFRNTAEALASRGARVDRLPAAAGLGRFDAARNLLATASTEDRHRALALAAQHGYVEIVRLLLDAGEDPNRFNPDGFHKHSTPLHQAALAGHDAVVRLLVDCGARLDLRDTIYHATPLGWAEYGGRAAVASYLSALEHRV